MKRDGLAEMLAEQVPRLRRYARALVRDAEEADKLVQKCIDKAWSHALRWGPENDARVWLFSIMHNLYVNRLKRTRRGPSTPPAVQAYRPSSLDREGPMGLADLEHGLAQLSQDQQETLLLVCVEEMSYSQVADVLGVPVGVVTERLHRARERLRRWMHPQQRPSLRRIK